ncbi:MAG: sel1 repeat family protein, partial [Gallionellaceae bacterium]|nr:sel1 repeat family protein [Gallionellaceae bacterium]
MVQGLKISFILFALLLADQCVAASQTICWKDHNTVYSAQCTDASHRADEWQSLAKEGNAEAQFHLGWMFIYGGMDIEDEAQGVAWMQKSANQGFVDAQVDLGDRYNNGDGDIVKKNPEQAQQWYRRAVDSLNKDAAQGNALAQINLGT